MTASVSFEYSVPYARRMSTLDHLTKGRISWNVVTSYLSSGTLNLGLSGPEACDQRCVVAEGYPEIAKSCGKPIGKMMRWFEMRCAVNTRT